MEVNWKCAREQELVGKRAKEAKSQTILKEDIKWCKGREGNRIGNNEWQILSRPFGRKQTPPERLLLVRSAGLHLKSHRPAALALGFCRLPYRQHSAPEGGISSPFPAWPGHLGLYAHYYGARTQTRAPCQEA